MSELSRRRLPGTTALAVFEAAARHESFTRAAEELAMTQSAVCRQVAGLEALLDVKLFRRTRRGVRLTEAGSGYALRVADWLDTLERDTRELMAGAGRVPVIELAVVPTFATCWLLPRLPAFRPGRVQVNLHSRTRPFLFDETRLDAAIHAGDGHWPGCTSRPILSERLIPVASAGLLTAHGLAPDGAPLPAEALARLPRLQQTTRPLAWRRWFAAAGLRVADDQSGPAYEQFSMSVQAAALGLGVALVPDFAAAAALADGRLRGVAAALDSELAYHYVVPESHADDALLSEFGDWLAAQAETHRETFHAARSTDLKE